MKTISLKDLIPYGKDEDGKAKELKEFTIRKPNAGELRGIKLRLIHDMDSAVLHDLLPRITSPVLTSLHVATLGPADTVAVFNELADFFQ